MLIPELITPLVLVLIVHVHEKQLPRRGPKNPRQAWHDFDFQSISMPGSACPSMLHRTSVSQQYVRYSMSASRFSGWEWIVRCVESTITIPREI
jgi:hypothetical protein